MTRFWLVRHAPTHAKAAIGWSDIAADFSDTASLARLDAGLPASAALVSSDLSRARLTADHLATGRTRLDDRADLREMHFGDWEGMTFDEIDRRDPDGARAFWQADGALPAPGGESLADVVARMGGALDALAGAHEDVVVVCHMGAIMGALAHALGQGPGAVMPFVIDPLSTTRIDALGSPAPWRIRWVNRQM